MGKKHLAIAICFLVTIIMPVFCNAARPDHIVISEVLYDPAGTETGGEAVELYNPTDFPIDISNYMLSTESSPRDATIPAETTLPARTFYLITDTGWSSSKDNTSWPEADHEEAITISNSDAGVALVHSNGTILDAVGWGNASEIDPQLFETSPTAPVKPGNSIKRKNTANDTDNNYADFTESLPDLHNSSSTTPNEDNAEPITIKVEVQNNAPVFNSFAIIGDEDNTTTGIQIAPTPAGTKNIFISAEVSDADGTEPSVTAVVTGPAGQKNITLSKTADISNTTWLFNGTIQMRFYDSPGSYNISITAGDTSSNTTKSLIFDYLSMAAISIDSTSLQFKGAKPGKTTEIKGDFALSTKDSPTIRNIGNTPIDIGLHGTDLTDGTKNISIDNVKYSFDNDFNSALAGTVRKNMAIQNLRLVNAADSVISLSFQLFVPASTQSGNYTGKVTLIAISS